MNSDLEAAAEYIDVDPKRMAGRVYEVQLDYLVTYTMRLVAGPEDYSAVESAREVANPAGCVDPSEWDLIHDEVDRVEPVWMGDHRAPKAASWLEEPHLPSEETYWDDSRHFDLEGGESDE